MIEELRKTIPTVLDKMEMRVPTASVINTIQDTHPRYHFLGSSTSSKGLVQTIGVATAGVKPKEILRK